MTTYLATETFDDSYRGRPRHWVEAQEITNAFCSTDCRTHYLGNDTGVERDDPSYEFDETCANCGSLVPA